MPADRLNEMDKDNIINAQLGGFVKEKTNQDQFSGVVLVANNQVVVMEYASGMANVESQTPNTIDTKFNLGSANKMFTGVAIAQLVEKGLVSFDDPVGKILPDYPNETVRELVTIHQLLTHTSGMGSFIDIEFREQLLAARSNLKTISSVVDLFKDRPLPYKNGESHYSSDGYEVLGLIIEALSGQSYYDYVKQHIFDIAGMSNTDSYEIDPKNPRPDIAVGYTNRDPLTNQPITDSRVDNLGINLLKGTAGGSGYSTAHDLLNFCQALLSHKLLSPTMTDLVISPIINEGSKGNQTKYSGYGFQIFDIGGVKRVGHPGRFAGVN
jgi:CubicO group peptidase (beta-lactamase class C family)